MSDIHGEFEKYKQMLQKIKFSDSDILYILGDVIDRGPEPVRILQHMSMRSNIYPIMGNHELMALAVLDRLLDEITEDNDDTHLNPRLLRLLNVWQCNGGGVTLEKIQALSNAEREDLLAYIKEFPLYETVDIGEKTYILVHAGLGNFRADKPLSRYSADELTYQRPNFSKGYFGDPNIRVVCGHTPTPVINGKAEIYHNNDIICIDCGVVMGGSLACLCLDTMQEFYV